MPGMERILEQLGSLFGLNSALSPLYLLGFAVIAWIVYSLRREEGGFLAFLLPRGIWSHKSIRIDLWMIGIGQVMAAAGLIARFAAAPAIATWVAAYGPGPLAPGIALSPVLLALIFFVVADFALYWIHRIFHTIPTIWPLHAVHHSAAVLTPLTAFRLHPLSQLITTAMLAVIYGTVLGLLVGALNPDVSYAQIAGVNAFVLITNLLLTNFHHSHIWISFGPVLERIVISPAQHQIHHSIHPRHFNKNYGQTLAIWDWMFGTLYLIREREEVTFGLDGPSEAPLMTQRLWPILIDPVRRLLFPAR